MNLQIRTNAQSNSTDYEASLAAELASYGYKSIDDLDDYCLTSVKEKEMNKAYVDEHFDEYKEAVESVSPRTVSIISMSVTDADELTDDEQKKKDNIDQALEDGALRMPQPHSPKMRQPQLMMVSMDISIRILPVLQLHSILV